MFGGPVLVRVSCIDVLPSILFLFLPPARLLLGKLPFALDLFDLRILWFRRGQIHSTFGFLPS